MPHQRLAIHAGHHIAQRSQHRQVLVASGGRRVQNVRDDARAVSSQARKAGEERVELCLVEIRKDRFRDKNCRQIDAVAAPQKRVKKIVLLPSVTRHGLDETRGLTSTRDQPIEPSVENITMVHFEHHHVLVFFRQQPVVPHVQPAAYQHDLRVALEVSIGPHGGGFGQPRAHDFVDRLGADENQISRARCGRVQLQPAPGLSRNEI
mmetsp:Transcript_12794/g.34429  ORF Transcript_12794/g.34429 Transcript_12794/m.34429 type:complete len:207 (-) Transcript_12794:229-849(-)